MHHVCFTHHILCYHSSINIMCQHFTPVTVMHHLQKEKENTQLFTRIFTPFSLKAELRITVQTVQF